MAGSVGTEASPDAYITNKIYVYNLGLTEATQLKTKSWAYDEEYIIACGDGFLAVCDPESSTDVLIYTTFGGASYSHTVQPTFNDPEAPGGVDSETPTGTYYYLGAHGDLLVMYQDTRYLAGGGTYDRHEIQVYQWDIVSERDYGVLTRHVFDTEIAVGHNFLWAGIGKYTPNKSCNVPACDLSFDPQPAIGIIGSGVIVPAINFSFDPQDPTYS